MAGIIAIYMVADGKPLRLMLLPIIFLMAGDIANIFCGRCYNHMLQHKKMADVIARWQMEWPL